MPNNQLPNDDNSLPPQTRPGGVLHKYKELIVTTIICLFLTGIYDSVNKQTEEIKRWYELMINLQAEQRIQSVDMQALKESLDNHRELTRMRYSKQEDRIQSLEYQLIPQRQQTDSTHE